MKKSNNPFVRKGYLAALALAVVFGGAQLSGINLLPKSLQTSVPGYSLPIDTSYSSFGCKSGGSWADTVWCSAYGSAYDSHVSEAAKHANTIVMFKRNLASYGDFYVVGNYGATATGKNGQTYYAGAIVECPSGATVQAHAKSHHLYSPSLGEGYYDGNSHYWCDQSGVSVDPVVKSNISGLDYSGTDKDKLFKFEFPDGTKKYKSYKDSTNANSSGWVKCTADSIVVGPYTGSAQYTNQYWVKEAGKRDYYRCYNPSKGTFGDAEADTAALASPYNSISTSYFKTDNVKNCDSTYATCQPSAAAGDSAYGGADTYGPVTQACASNTYWCQTTSTSQRYCSSTPTCSAASFTPPGPTWTLADPSGLFITSAKTDNKYNKGDSITFVGGMNYTGTGFPSISAKLYTFKVSKTVGDFSNPIWKKSFNSNSSSTTLSGTYSDGTIPVGGPYYYCVEVEMKNDNSFFTTTGTGDQKTACVPAAGSFTIVDAPVSTCALSIKLNDSKTTYNKGDMVNYTYSCSPSGTKAANTYVWLGKPDGSWTQYNSGTNIDTATLGFSTSNLDAGAYTLKVCPDSACTGGVASTAFSVAASATTTDTPTTTPTTTTTTPTTTTPTTTSPKGCAVGETCQNDGSWCNNGKQCYNGDGSFQCSDWNSACPSGTKKCSPTDTNCIEPGSIGSLSGWCKDAMECYSGDGKTKYCQEYNYGDPAAMTTSMFKPASCPAEYPRTCNPTDTNCVEIGQKGPSTGWCASGGKQCYLGDGSLFCADYDSSCPADASVCRAGDTNCIEPGKYGPTGGWCGGSSSFQCYKSDGSQKYCAQISGLSSDPQAWEKVSCPTGTSKCQKDDKYCLAEIGATGPSGSWCATGMSQYNSDGTVTCVSANNYKPPVLIVDPLEPDACVQVATKAYDPSTSKCKTFASSCNVPAGWMSLQANQLCKDGIVAKLDTAASDIEAALRFIRDKQNYLSDLALQVRRAPEYVADVRPLSDKITEAQKTLKELSQSTDLKYLKDQINLLNSSVLNDIETRWGAMSSYVQSSDLKKEIRVELANYKAELFGIDAASDYAGKLDSGIKKLEDLLVALETTQTAQARDELTRAIKTVRKELFKLVQDRRIGKTDDSVQGAVDSHKQYLEKVKAVVVERNIDDTKVLFTLDRYEMVIDDLRSPGDSGNFYKGHLLDEADRIRENLNRWMGGYIEGYSAGVGLSIDELLHYLEPSIARAVDQAFENIKGKLQVMMDEALQKAAVTIVKALESADEGMQKRAAVAVANMAHLPDAHREAVVTYQNKIYDKLSNLNQAIGNSGLGDFTAQQLRDAMAELGTVTWCGENAETVQSRINTVGLKLEVGELTSDEINDLTTEIAELRVNNTDLCYQAGMTPGRDVPVEEWYYPYAQYNYDRGLMHGYNDADGNPVGQFGVANSTLRMEALAMAMRIFDVPVGAYVEPAQGFAGIPYWPTASGENEANTYVNGALAAGVNLSDLQPFDAPISRLEVAKLFVRFMKALNVEYFTSATDVDVANKYSDVNEFRSDTEGSLAIEALTDAGIFEGGGDGGFHPYDPLLRSEFATTNERLIETYNVELPQ